MVRRSRDAEAELNLPPGFRFYPTDEELVLYYLCRKASHQFLPTPIIAEVDLYKYNPWQLPEKALFGQKEWYFFTPRERKYPNGSRPNRAAGSGYWKATGPDKPVTPAGSSRPLGIKKALVFYAGKAPRGTKTNWIMHEYRLADSDRSTSKKGSLKLDDWVLCRLYNKKNNWEKGGQQQNREASFRDSMHSPEAVLESHKSKESDVDSGEFAETAEQASPEIPVKTPDSTEVVQGVVKEDNDWFWELKLDDLQNSFAASGRDGSRLGMDIPFDQESYLSGF